MFQYSWYYFHSTNIQSLLKFAFFFVLFLVYFHRQDRKINLVIDFDLNLIVSKALLFLEIEKVWTVIILEYIIFTINQNRFSFFLSLLLFSLFNVNTEKKSFLFSKNKRLRSIQFQNINVSKIIRKGSRGSCTVSDHIWQNDDENTDNHMFINLANKYTFSFLFYN
jgi:hypothetical protein